MEKPTNFDAMNNKVYLPIGISALFICFVCGSLLAFLKPSASVLPPNNSKERVHLALRRTAHLLLKQAGDSTSTIPPIEKSDAQTYLVKLNHSFNYDSLPAFLQSSFDVQGITDKYDVVVYENYAGLLLLGYSSTDYQINNDVPCVGRNPTKGNLNFSVTFTTPSVKRTFSPYFWFFLGGFCVLAIALATYFFNKKAELRKIQLTTTEPDAVQKIDAPHLIYIGQTLFDTHNQTLKIANTEQKLTYQEVQLLQLFCQYKNEILERDFILKTVWGDDGVLITRSVDVFVSRLRKLLKSDASLKIATVHNRGYRFETNVS